MFWGCLDVMVESPLPYHLRHNDLTLSLPQTIIIGLCKQQRSRWDGSYEPSNVVWNLAPKELLLPRSDKIMHLVKQAWNLACMFTMANFYIKAHWPRKNSKWRTKWRPFSKWPPFKTCNHSLLPKTSQNWPICMVFVSNCMFMKSRNLNLHIFCLYFLFLVIFVPNVRRKRLLFVTNWLYCRSCWDT